MSMNAKQWQILLRENSLIEGIQDDFVVIDELAKLLKVGDEKADSILSGFKSGASLNQMRKYWAAIKTKNYKKAAQVVKREWC